MSLLAFLKSHYIACIIILIICIIFGWYLYKNRKDLEEIIKETEYQPSLNRKRKKHNKHEAECRRIIENIFLAPFPSVRPNFLKNPETGKNLEIDMYNDYYKIGFEYQGIQHRKYSPYFHKSYNDFIEQLRRDDYKKRVCENMGIMLIYIPDTVKYDDLKQYITSELKNKIRIERNEENIE